MHDECWSAVVALRDLGIRANAGDLLAAGDGEGLEGLRVPACDLLLVRQTVDQDRDHLRFPVHVQDDAPALVGETHEEGARSAFV